MATMTHAKFHFNWLMVTLIFGIWASEPPPSQARRTTEKAGPGRIRPGFHLVVAVFWVTGVSVQKLLQQLKIPE